MHRLTARSAAALPALVCALLLCSLLALAAPVHAQAPTITGFSPTSGPVGTTVVLTGTNFTGATVVGFQNQHATSFTVNSNTQITTAVPNGAATGPVAVATPGGTAHSSTNFTVTVAAPTITSFTPTSGPVGTSVTITGTSFTGATAVTFNGTAATTFSVVSATSITATVPMGAATGTIAVTTPGGTATSSSSFTVTVPAPTITGFSPTSGPVGTTVVITGTNFTGTTVVGFQGQHATSFMVNSSTQITTAVPNGAATGPVAVATPGGTAHSSASFTVTTGGSAPTITSFTPAAGPAGTTVTLTGTNFTGASAVTFNGSAAASFTVVSATSITAVVPAGATSGAIMVTTPSGSVTTTSTFTVYPQIDAGSTMGLTASGMTSGGVIVWAADNGTPTPLNSSRMLTTTVSSFTSVPAGVPYQLFQSQRVSDGTALSGGGTGLSFTETSVANGTYTLNLYFAEIQSGVTAGQRVFNVLVNGQPVLSSFDITQAALDNGATTTLDTVVTESVPVTVSGGAFTVAFQDVTGKALVGAFSLSGPPSPAADVPPPGWAEGVIPTDDGTDADGIGPAMSLGVSLPSQVEEIKPGADISAYNALGPSVAYERMFRGNLAKSGYGSPGLSPGWTDAYDLYITPINGGYTLTYPNGAVEAWTGTTGSLTVPSGAPYLAYSSTGTPNTIRMEFKDRTVYTFSQVSTASANYPATAYLLSKITNLVGRSVAFNRDTAANNYRVLTIQNDASTPKTLLNFVYSGAVLSKVQDLASPNASENREVEYNFSGTPSLLQDVTTVQAVGTGFTSRNDQWQYLYTAVGSASYVATVKAPDPSSPGSFTSAAVTLTASGLVSAFTDADSHYRSYAPATSATQVSVFTKATDATPLETWTPSYQAGSTNAGTGGRDGLGDQSMVRYNQNVPPGFTPSPSGYLPSVDIDRNGHPASLTYDTSNTYGNVLTSTVSGTVPGTTISRSDTTTSTYDYSTFALGELRTAQESYAAEDAAGVMTSGQKQETTFNYFQPSDGAINGLVSSVASPAPDTVNGASTVTTSYTYSLPVLTGSGYASGGNVTSVTDPGNETGAITTTYNYTNDPSYNATGGTGSYSQNEAVGEPLTAVDALSHTTHFRYDGRGNRTYVIDALGNVTSYIYNLANQLTGVFYPPISGNPIGAFEIYTYQYTGGPLMEADLYSEGTAYPLMGGTPYRTTTYAYDHEGQTTSETDLKGLLGTWNYDARGRVNQSGDGKNNYTHYAYTQAGSLYQELYPGASIAMNSAYDNQYTGTPGALDTMTYGYDPDQNVISTEDGRGALNANMRGVMTSYVRTADPESLVTETDYSNLPASVTAINSVLYAYDGYGRRMSMDDTTGSGQSGSTKTYTYDDLDELESVTTSFLGGPQSQALTYTHNGDGSRRSMTTPTGVANPLLAAGYVYFHDQAHRFTAVNFPWYKQESATRAEQQTLFYFDNNWLQQSSNSQVKSSYNYTQRGFLKSLANNNYVTADGGNFLADQLAVFSNFTYDAVGNRTAETGVIPENTGTRNYNYSHTTAYTYDQRDELTEENSTAATGNTAPGTANETDVYDQTFGFDLAYNRTAYANTLLSGSPYSYMFGADNQNTSGGFTYDGSGNPSQYNGSAASNLAYDPEQRLTGIADKAFSAHYDGDGMRDYIIVRGATTYYLYDGSSPVIEETYSASPSPTTTIAAANGFADGWRERYIPAGPVYYTFSYDPQGNLAVTNASNKQAITPALSVSVYDGYGNRLVSQDVSSGTSPEPHQDPAQFGGQYGYYTDLSTGEVQLTHRYYDASTGHFLNRDPIGYSGGQNLYAFCGNNPITGSDPSGFQERDSTGGNPFESDELNDIEDLNRRGDEEREREREAAGARLRRYMAEQDPHWAILQGPIKSAFTSRLEGDNYIETNWFAVEPSDIGTGTQTNRAMRRYVRSQGKPTDDAGHKKGALAGGSGTEIVNVYPQDPHVNRGENRVFEQEVAREVLRQNFGAVWKQELVFTRWDMRRPYEIRNTVYIGNVTLTKTLPNP